MMTLPKMQFAICKLLPEYFDTESFDGWLKPNTKFNPDRHCVIPCNWAALGLQIYHEAEKLVNNSINADKYTRNLLKVCRNLITREDSFIINTWTTFSLINATYEQRLEALCKTLFPKKFD